MFACVLFPRAFSNRFTRTNMYVAVDTHTEGCSLDGFILRFKSYLAIIIKREITTIRSKLTPTLIGSAFFISQKKSMLLFCNNNYDN